MTTISWKMEGGFRQSDFEKLDAGIKSPYNVWEELAEEYYDKALDISNPKAVGKVMENILSSYADVFERVYNRSAEEYAAYAVHRMFQNLESVERAGGGDINIGDILQTDKFFEVNRDKKWTTSPRGYNVAGKGLNSGLYGSFLEQELFGLQPGEGREARFSDLAEVLHGSISQQDIKSKSFKTGKKPSSKNVDVGGVTFNIGMQESPDSYAKNLPSGLMRDQEDKLLNSAIELGEKLQIEFADALSNKEISEYIIGRTLGIFKLFEKVAGVLIFGVEVQDHDQDRAIFRYTSATTYARLRFDEILKEVRANPQSSQILGVVDVNVKYTRERMPGLIFGQDSLFGKLLVTVSLKGDALDPKDVNNLELGTKLYKDIYNIFSNVQEKTNFFKAMYKEFQQERDIATNIEIEALKKQMHRFKGQSNS